MSPKSLIFKLLRYSGLPLLFREVLQRNKVSIVMFHDIGPEEATRAFAFLAAKYNVISLEDFLEARRKGSVNHLPPKSLIITLDDGYARNYQLLPVVRNLKIPITIFLCSGLLNTNRHFWFLYKRKEMHPEKLKKLSNVQRLNALETAGFSEEREFEQPHALNKQQVLDMKGHINLQAHTVFHPCLSRCTDREAWKEISDCKQTLEEEYGLRINALAYPNGDYTERDIELVKKADYQCAITVDYGFNTLKTDAFKLKRLSIDDSGDIDALSLKASGVWTFFRTLFGIQRKDGWAQIKEPSISKKLEPLIYFSILITDNLCELSTSLISIS